MSVEAACMIVMVLALVGGMANRLLLRKGIGLRFCQYLAISMGIPAIIMLAFADKIEKHVVATLLGAIIGFFVSHAGRDET